MKQIEGQMTIEGTQEIKPLIYSLSLTWWHTICPYCKCDNPNSTQMNDCTKRDEGVYSKSDIERFYPYWDLPLDYCPACGKQFDDEHCEVKMTKDFMKASPEYVAKLWKDEKGRWRD